MSTDVAAFEARLARVEAGEPLTQAEIDQLMSSPDILQLGMLADAARRRANGNRVTYVRVWSCTLGEPWQDIPAAAREVRLLGEPSSLPEALEAVARARSVAGDRAVSGFSWSSVSRLAEAAGTAMPQMLRELRAAGLDALAEIGLDTEDDLSSAVGALVDAGFATLRLTIAKSPAAARVALFRAAASLQDRYSAIQAVNPLPLALNTFRPTTGYEDVKMVAIARLAAPRVPSIQVDWLRYGPKLAQVALTFGADDLDNVSASDEAPDGRRRAPLEEVRRNIEAAGFAAVERDGRYVAVS